MPYIAITNEMKTIAKTVDLKAFLLSRYPEDIIKYKSNYVRKDRHSVKLIVSNKAKQYITYCDYSDPNESTRCGDNIKYLMTYHGKTYPEAVQELASFENRTFNEPQPITETKQKPVIGNKPPMYYELGIDEVKRYLVNVRKLNQKIVEDCMNKGLIYPTQYISKHGNRYTNVVFKYRNFFCVKGITATYNMNSSGYEYWEYIPSDKEKKDIKYLFICEAPIDALSLCELLDNKDSAFVAMGGLSKTKADKAIAAHKNARVFIATDWDNAGIVFHHQYYQGVYQSFHPKDITGTKDWNEELKRRKENKE